jgi:hypothetical protein
MEELLAAIEKNDAFVVKRLLRADPVATRLVESPALYGSGRAERSKRMDS